ncbi:MAG: NAD(P)-dependent alcohol dehydrogenase [Pseudomonadota bacterium]
MMRAISYRFAGSSSVPDVAYAEVPKPEVNAGDVLVRVHFAGLSNFEKETSEGKRKGSLTRAMQKKSVVSGIEMAGVVERGCGTFSPGDKVVGYTNIFRGPFLHSDYVAIPPSKLALIPDNISLQGAASIVGGALTSITALERIAGITADQKLLVTGATGSVGITAVQLASHLGAQVSGVCHSSQTDFVSEQGAIAAFAYDKDELPAQNGQFHLVFDTAPSLGFASASGYLTPQGTFISTMPQLDITGFLRSVFSRKKWGYLMESDTDQARMSRLQDLMKAGAFCEVIDSIYPLPKASDAFAHQLERGKRGKILIDFSDQ